jgi:hypothetical protein
LADHGLDIGSIPEAQRAVLAGLSEEEATVLSGILERMAPEVEGYAITTLRANPALLDNAMKLGGQNPTLKPGQLADDTGGLFW